MNRKTEDNNSVSSTIDPPLFTQVSGDIIGSSSIQVTELREAPQERASRLKREEDDSALKRWKDKFLFVISVLSSVVIAGICIYIVTNPNTPSDLSEWARSILTLIIGGFIGFLTGKATK